MNVYYESLCPDSAKFINEQLYPALQQFRGNVDLKLIPFGKASYRTQGSETTFECHHGPNECYGNKVHACAIQHIEGSSYEPNNTKEVLTLNYVNCLMERAQLKSGEFPGESCARDTDIRNWENIAACANDTEGSDLLRKAGDETNKLQKPLTSVPTVAFRQVRLAFDSLLPQCQPTLIQNPTFFLDLRPRHPEPGCGQLPGSALQEPQPGAGRVP